MSTQIPDDEISTAIVEHQLSLSATLLRCLLRQLAVALPLARDTPEAVAAEDHQAARELFFAMRPRDPEEAAAAVRAVTAHFAAMDLHARASRPGLGDETAMRLRARANATARCAILRRGKSERPPAPGRNAPAEPPPQNRQAMTGAPRRAASGPQYDADIAAAALADAAAIIAGQKARPTGGDVRQS
jgi:hypothetical protein